MAVARNIDTVGKDANTLPECMLYMLKNEIMCDVTFHAGVEEKPIKAHKYMMSSRSPVYRTMFEGSLSEKGVVILIPDIEEPTFRAFLQYIYSDMLSISNDNVKEMLYLSDKYMVTRVKKECEKVLQKSASTRDAAKSLQMAYTYNLDNLLDQSLTFIETNTVECLASECALDLSKECLELILKSEYLSCSETDLCSFFLKWTKNKCNLAKIEADGKNMRTIAGHLLFLVRFPLIDPEIFTKYISTIGLLTQSETLSIYQCNFGFTGKKLVFSNKERKQKPVAEIFTVTRFQRETCGWHSQGVEALKFETNKNIWLKGVVIGSLLNPVKVRGGDGPDGNTFRFKILSADDSELYSFEHFAAYFYTSTTTVTFPRPLRISKCTKYTIMIEGMVSSYYSTNPVARVTVSDVTFTFEKIPLGTSGPDDFAGLMFSI